MARSCEYFTNLHCISPDCPDIMVDMIDERCGVGIAEDCGFTRCRCRDCIYNDARCSCSDCLFEGSVDCPEVAKNG